MSAPDETTEYSPAVDPADRDPIRSVGTWIIAGFLVLSVVVI